jgi:hypothetical protein
MRTKLLVPLLLSLLVACGLPDLKPFSDATADMAAVLKQGFERTQTALNLAAEAADDDNQDTFKKNVQELDARWKPTGRALSALVAYSDALTGLAEAGKNGKETMARLTGAVNELADAVGAIPLTGAAAGVVQAVGARIIQIQAERDIRKAVGQAADLVNTMAPLLKANFEDLRRIHGTSMRSWETRLQARSTILMDYYESLAAEEQRLQFLLNLIIQFQSAPARLRWRAAMARARGENEQAARFEASIRTDQLEQLRQLKASDPGSEAIDVDNADTAARVETRQQQLMNLLNAQRKEIALLEPKYQQATAELANLRAARATGDRILEKAGDAIDAWQKAHRSLQAAAQGQQSRPSVAELLSTTKEIAALLK